MTGVLTVPGPRRTAGRDVEDHELVARIRGGDDRAFEILFERYQARITAYVRGMVRDHARAEDITQEVFFNALRRMRDTDRSIAFRPWIYEIAKNACIDAHRRSRRTQEVSYDHEDGLGAADQGRLVSPRAVTDAVETRESLESLQGALGALSESHVDVLVLRELEGRSYAEIGEQLGMSRASVESTLFRARKRLESEYNDLVTGERCRQVQAAFEALDGGRPGLRDRRRISRHLAWCQACRHQARLAGSDIEVAPRVPLRKKVGGLFPVPAFIREWIARGVLPGQIAGAGEPLLEWGRAAVAAVIVAVAGIGAGQVIGGGPVVDARPYAPGAAVYGDAGATPVLGKAYALVGGRPALRSWRWRRRRRRSRVARDGGARRAGRGRPARAAAGCGRARAGRRHRRGRNAARRTARPRPRRRRRRGRRGRRRDRRGRRGRGRPGRHDRRHRPRADEHGEQHGAGRDRHGRRRRAA